MQFLKTLGWVLVAVLVAIVAGNNWRDVTIDLWSNLQVDIKVPVLLLAVFLAWLATHDGTREQQAVLTSLAGGAAFLGHLFPVWLKFKGGKGVWTFLGTMLAAAGPEGRAAARRDRMFGPGAFAEAKSCARGGWNSATKFALA